MLTEADIVSLLGIDGSREDMLRAAYRGGMERAAEICAKADKSMHPSDLADAIRAEAE